MNCKKHFLHMIVFILSMFLFLYTSVSHASTGHLDTADISIVITNIATGEVSDTLFSSASGYRNDPVPYGHMNVNFGFWVSPDWESYGDGLYSIEAYKNGCVLGNPLFYNNTTKPIATSTSVIYAGVFTTTAYCPCPLCCGKWGKTTSSGTVPSARHTIAVDTDIFPYGTKLFIDGVLYVAEDTGSGVNGNHIDIFFNTHNEALVYGLQHKNVYIIK